MLNSKLPIEIQKRILNFYESNFIKMEDISEYCPICDE